MTSGSLVTTRPDVSFEVDCESFLTSLKLYVPACLLFQTVVPCVIDHRVLSKDGQTPANVDNGPEQFGKGDNLAVSVSF